MEEALAERIRSGCAGGNDIRIAERSSDSRTTRRLPLRVAGAGSRPHRNRCIDLDGLVTAARLIGGRCAAAAAIGPILVRMGRLAYEREFQAISGRR